MTGEQTGENLKLFAFIAAVIALIGLVDAAYLTVHHLTAEPVPCSVTGGCETVLTSKYAEFAGVPLAAFGAIAYFAAFSLAIMAAFGNRTMWRLFQLLAIVMGLFSIWLLYVQASIIGAFCQYCLVSAGTSLMLAAIALVTLIFRK